MIRGPLLIPNLGAEEGPGWRRRLAWPELSRAARLWRVLFPVEARWADGLPPLAWPPGIPEASGDALPWLGSGASAHAWLADAEALGIASARGCALAAPDPEVVRRCHDKAFAVRFAAGAGLEPACWRRLSRVFEPEELCAGAESERAVLGWVETWPTWTGGRFSLKPRQGSSARGRAGGRLEGPRSPWSRALPRLARCGGAVLEPWVERIADFAAEFHIGPEGRVAALGSLQQECSASGAPRGHRGVFAGSGRTAAGAGTDLEFEAAALSLVQAAAAAGYRGPCGVDGFLFRGPGGQPVLRPLVELNARFTMGHVALGVLARLLPDLRPELAPPLRFRLAPRTASAAPGTRAALRFELFGPDESAAGAPVLELGPARSADQGQGPTSMESGSSCA